jgi:hypothetical protein
MSQKQPVEKSQHDTNLMERVMQECYAACGIW